MKVYGPYTRKDKRKHVIILYDDGRRRTVSYPKFLMEQHLGRELGPDVTVDHLDRNFDNNEISNLRLRPRSPHATEDVHRVERIAVECIWCGERMERSPSALDRNARLGKAGPFCKSCAGRYGKSVQEGAERLPAQPRVPPDDRTYYQRPKAGCAQLVRQGT